jgi:hypothetical protein
LTSGTLIVAGGPQTVHANLGGRERDEVFISVSGSTGDPTDVEQVPCTDSAAPAATVLPTLTNIDEIVFDTAGGVRNALWQMHTFGPGKSPEPGAAEIETVIGSSVDSIWLSVEQEERQIELGSVGDTPGIDLNRHEETSGDADPDLTFLPDPSSDPTSTPVWISSRAPLRVDGTGQDPFVAPFPGAMAVDSSHGDDYLAAGTGPARLSAGGGSNTVVGSPADDVLSSDGPATISAGNGDDHVIGGFGDSQLDGGTGDDLLSFGGWEPPGDSSRGVHFRI